MIHKYLWFVPLEDRKYILQIITLELRIYHIFVKIEVIAYSYSVTIYLRYIPFFFTLFTFWVFF